MHRTCREKLFESSPTSPSRTFERGRRRQRSVWGQVLSQIKITLCNRRRGGPCGGAEGDGSEDLHTEYGVKSLSKPRRGGGRGHYLNVRVILIADNGYKVIPTFSEGSTMFGRYDRYKGDNFKTG